MTDTVKLKVKMLECKYTIKTISEAIGLSSTGFFNKLSNKREFCISEVQMLRDVLALSDDEVLSIFFEK